MSELGICSRREADDLISKGLVYVDGERVSELGVKIHPDQQIRVSSEGRSQLSSKLTVLINKPIGFVSSQPEDGYKAAVELLTPENYDGKCPRLRRGWMRGLAPAGRLDIDSKGLLILTQDGVLAKRVISQDTEIEKEYLIWINKEPSQDQLAKLRFGLNLDEKELKPAQVEQLQPKHLKVILKEGRKRQIRRMCELVGLEVTGLKRVRIGKIMLGNLPNGKWRFLDREDSF